MLRRMTDGSLMMTPDEDENEGMTILQSIHFFQIRNPPSTFTLFALAIRGSYSLLIYNGCNG
jgi:hypothetical protein